MDWRETWTRKQKAMPEVIRHIPKGTHIFVGSGAAQPVGLVEEMVRQSDRFADNTVVHLLTLGPAPYVEERYQDRFRHNAFFIGPNVREAVHQGRADYTPVFLSQIPGLIRRRRMPVDVALVQVTPPDAFGYVNLGVSVDIVAAALESADLILAEVNPRMPRVRGSGYLRVEQVDAWTLREAPLPEVPPEPPDDVALEIGRNVASLVKDGSTLQIGIGQIPDAVLASLGSKKDLGVWTEMMPDGLVALIENGNVTGRFKTLEPHKVTTSFAFGTQQLYDYLDGNPTFSFQPSDRVNDPLLIARQHRMVAINTALQVDLTGQVCADSIGTRFYSGIGGQVDFIRGASMCPGGRPILAIRSTAKDGALSRIVPVLNEGAGVVTSRGDVRYVVTEFGIADLLGRSVRDRAMALISVSHPDFRGELLAAAKGRRLVFQDQLVPRPPSPRTHRKRVRTRDGKDVLFRPVEVTDEKRMQDMFYSFSEATVRKRWHGVVPRMPHKDLQRYLDADDQGNVAIVAEYEDGDHDPIMLGVGRFHLAPATGLAEVAFVMRDEWQGKGLGTKLLRHLVEIAQHNGIRGFTAEVLAGNPEMMHVFHKLGAPVESSLSGDVYVVTIPFDAPPAPPSSRPPEEPLATD